MKSVLVIGDLNDKLKSVLEKAKKQDIIYHYVNYEIYNEIHETANEQLRLTTPVLSNEQFCDMFINTTKRDELLNEWIILKGNIHTKDFIKILIKFERTFDPLNRYDLFLSHVVKLVSKRKNMPSFYLSDAALNVKQMIDHNVLGNVIENAKDFVSKKIENPKTVIILAADNKSIPYHDVITQTLDVHFWNNKIEIKQFDECFDLASYLNKNPNADAESFTYPDLLITDITVGNCIWKSLTILNDYYAIGQVIGGQLNTILLSRSDSEESYLESIKNSAGK